MTDTATLTLADFLSARLDEDEAVARRATEFWAGAAGGQPEVVDHVFRHDPARVLAEVDAKRRIVEEHSPHPEVYGDYCPSEDGRYRLDHCPTLRLLALPYAEHDDYREEWRP